MIRRRAVLAALSGFVVLPATRAEGATPSGKIGYLHPVTVSPSHPTLNILRRAWLGLGYVEGDTVLLRSANRDPLRLQALVAELISQGAAVLIVVGADAVKAARRATSATPIVAIDLETDPVRAGLAASFSRPGGNVTGLFLDLPSLAGKWIELLRELAPNVERIAFAWDPAAGRDQLDIALAVAAGMNIEAAVLEAETFGNFDAAFRSLARDKRTGIIQLTSPGFATVATEFAAAAQRHNLPTVAFLKNYAKAGLLMTYGPSQEDYFQRAVVIADKILKGEQAGEIPLEQPTKFELAINLKTAAALGLTIPLSILLRADEVIE